MFLLVPPNYFAPDFLQASRDLIASLATAVTDSGVEHTVLLSSMGAQQSCGTGPIVTVHWAEEALRAAAANITTLRAAYFLENWAPSLPVAQEHGVLPTFLTPDRPIDTIATADSLLHPAQGLRIRHVAGPPNTRPRTSRQPFPTCSAKPVTLAPAPASDAPAAFDQTRAIVPRRAR